MATKVVDLVWQTDQPSYCELFETGAFADAQIHLGNKQTWKVHTAIVSIQSEHLREAFTGDCMKADAKTTTLDYGPLEEAAVDAVLRFLYTGVIDLGRSYLQHLSKPLVALMKIWVVADYLRVQKLLDIIAKIQTQHMNALGRVLSASTSVKSDYKEEHHVIAAIEYLERFRDLDYQAVIPAFQPTLLRLVLCGRHRLPTQFLCEDYPEFVEGWEGLLDCGEIVYPMCSLPETTTCQKCERELFSGAMRSPGVRDHVMLDIVKWNMGGKGLAWICNRCFSIPSLKEWEEVKTTLEINREKEALEMRFDAMRTILDQHQSNSWARLMSFRAGDL
ncbi:unnamed protein product [Discula destructiva]